MLRNLLRLEQPFHIARQEEASLLRERTTFLEHLLKQGTAFGSTRRVMATAERH